MKILVDMNLSPEWTVILTESLALTHAEGPSVLQIRGQKALPEQISSIVVPTIRQYEEELKAGALLVVEESKSRIRILPL